MAPHAGTQQRVTLCAQAAILFARPALPVGLSVTGISIAARGGPEQAGGRAVA